ncbi:hypothetical protein SYNPS1DRAFT_30880, partial [Syncephalis pseudoplumigaleata]
MAEINDGVAVDPPGECLPDLHAAHRGPLARNPPGARSTTPVRAHVPHGAIGTRVLTTTTATAPVAYSQPDVRVVLLQSLVAALLKHVCSDAMLPVFGYLGGHASQRVVEGMDMHEQQQQQHRHDYLQCQASDFVASERAVDTLLNEMPAETMGSLERATLLFRDRGLDCIGWYRSVPDAQDFQPTLADVQRQRHMQRQYPWAVGALLAPPPPAEHAASAMADVAPLVHLFRVVPSFLADQYDSAGNIIVAPLPPAMDIASVVVRVPFAFASRAVPDPVLFRRQQHMLMNTLAESRKAHALQQADNEHRRAACAIADAEYDAFLTDFWKSNVVELSRSIEHDFRTLAIHKVHLKRQVADRVRALASLRTKRAQAMTGATSEADAGVHRQQIEWLLGR